MARITRTQKFSDLRNQLENDHETEIKSEGLSQYEQKLKTVEETLKVETTLDDFVLPKVEEVLPPVVEEVKPLQEQTVEEVKPLQETTVEEVGELNHFMDDLNDLLSMIDTEPVVEKEVVLETPVVAEEKPQVDDFNMDDLLSSLEEIVGPKVEEVKPVVEEVAAPSVEEVVVKNEFLQQTLDEVNEYNKSKGLMTADDVPSAILDEIRGGTKEELKPEVEETKVEDDFSNTVTLEIKKILETMNEEAAKEEVAEEANIQKLFETTGIPKETLDLLKPYLKEEVQEVIEPLQEETPVVEEVFEHPVAVLEEEKVEDAEPVLEIKPLEETFEAELVAETTAEQTILNDTIPFVLEDQKEEVDEDYDEEDSTPNKILNIILIILIIALLAVLGVIIYWILLAQGIL